MTRPVVHFEIRGRDAQRLREFYASLFGWEINADNPMGYGFIAPDDGGKDIFVHITAVQRAGLESLADNQKVHFELREGRDGRQSASDLELL